MRLFSIEPANQSPAENQPQPPGDQNQNTEGMDLDVDSPPPPEKKSRSSDLSKELEENQLQAKASVTKSSKKRVTAASILEELKNDMKHWESRGERSNMLAQVKSLL